MKPRRSSWSRGDTDAKQNTHTQSTLQNDRASWRRKEGLREIQEGSLDLKMKECRAMSLPARRTFLEGGAARCPRRKVCVLVTVAHLEICLQVSDPRKQQSIWGNADAAAAVAAFRASPAGVSLLVRGLRLHASNAGDTGFIPGSGS